MQTGLGILGLGVDLPESVDVVEHVRAAGGDPTDYTGWPRATHAGTHEHPSTMGSAALKRALADAGVEPREIGLVIYTGTSRDYPASWSVSTELIELCGVGQKAIGMDLMAGCLATLTALEFAEGWLRARGGGHAAVVAAERWTTTVDYANGALKGLWGYGDGAAAAVVGVASSRPAILELRGVEYRNAAFNNGYVRMAYGGTRAPVAPRGTDPNARILDGRARRDIIDLYAQGYMSAFDDLRARVGIDAEHLVCNQTTPGMVAKIAGAIGLGDAVTVTGNETGHLGGPDLLVGLHRLVASGDLPASIALGASAAYGFGAGLAVTPADEANAPPSSAAGKDSPSCPHSPSPGRVDPDR